MTSSNAYLPGIGINRREVPLARLDQILPEIGPRVRDGHRGDGVGCLRRTNDAQTKQIAHNPIPSRKTRHGREANAWFKYIAPDRSSPGRGGDPDYAGNPRRS
jgi:hypothetical protein